MHRITVFLGTVCLLAAQIVIAANPKTMRVDFYHTRNSESEIFSLDRVVLEPLQFPGNLQQPIDKTLRGKYLFVIVDPDSGSVAWSRSFSSIYAEYIVAIENNGDPATKVDLLLLGDGYTADEQDAFGEKESFSPNWNAVSAKLYNVVKYSVVRCWNYF